MAAISGHKAAVKVTSAAVTTSTNQAATLSSGDAVTLQINAVAQRHWDDSSTSHPKVYDHSVSTGTALSSTLYTINYVQGKVVFKAVRSTANTYMMDVQYVTASSWANANQWSMNVDQPILDATVFGSTWREGQPGLRTAGVSLGGFWNVAGVSTDANAFEYIDTDTKVILELHPESGEYMYEAYAWVTGDQVQASVDSLVGESIEFTVDGPMYSSTST
jgi:hypothetical protein